MRKIMKTVAAVAIALPLAAAADIANSKHDLASTSSATIKSSTLNQTCLFCHTPHFAPTQSLLWNRTNTNTGFGVGLTTTRGTALPTSVNNASAACIGCHDGSASLNTLSWNGLDSATGNELAAPTMAGGVNAVRANFDVVNATPNLNGNHPVSVPYPTDSMYVVKLGTGCTNASGLCTTGHLNVQLYGTLAAPLIECGSCHEPHNRYTQNFFLRETESASTICKACHIK